jgi:hypothetical protein
MSHLKLVPKNEHLIREVFTDFQLSREAMLCSLPTPKFYTYSAGKFIDWFINIQSLTLKILFQAILELTFRTSETETYLLTQSTSPPFIHCSWSSPALVYSFELTV